MTEAHEEAASVRHCPWCSAPLPEDAAERCPSCGASLDGSDAEVGIPGVTEVDPSLRAYEARSKKPRRTGVLAWLLGSGREGDEPAARAAAIEPQIDQGAIEPPSDEVKRAMLQIELEAAQARAARDAELAARPTPDAEAGARASEANAAEVEAVGAEATEATEATEAEAAEAELARSPAEAEPEPESPAAEPDSAASGDAS